MKRFLLLAAAAVVLASCGSKQYTWEDLVFDYPGLYEVKLPENDINDNPNRHLFFVEDGIDSSLDLISIEIWKQDPDELADASEPELGEFLAESAFDEITMMALEDKDFQFYEKPESVADVKVSHNSTTGQMEAHTYAKGHWNGEDLYVEANCMTFDGRYTITMYAQSKTESYLKMLTDIYRSVHLAEAK